VALILRGAVVNFLQEQEVRVKANGKEEIPEDLIIREQMSEDMKPSQKMPEVLSKKYLPDVVLFAYFMNPFTLLTSLSPSSVPLTILSTVLSIFYSQKKSPIFATLFLAVATYISIYPVCLVVPITLVLCKDTPAEPMAYLYHTNLPIGLFAKVLFMLGFWLTVLVSASYSFLGSWDFVKDVYGWVFLCQDLTPNVGLYWYFFAEAFPRFQGYFLLVFAAHPFLYLVPLTLRLGMYPLKLACILIAINSIFKVYPCVGDASFALCLFLMFPTTLVRMRNVVFYAVLGIFPLVLMPVMLYLWLVTGSGNVNFFYFQSLLYNFCLSMFVLQFIAASMRHRKALVSTMKQSNRQINEQDQKPKKD